MRKALAIALLSTLAVSAVPNATAQQGRETPYWASISAGKALMRTGPGKNYPAIWLYQRADLPIKVLEVYPSWRKVQDPDGTTGWMLVNLLSDTRTAIVRGTEPRPLHEAPQPGSRVVFRAEPGVVGRIPNARATGAGSMSPADAASSRPSISGARTRAKRSSRSGQPRIANSDRNATKANRIRRTRPNSTASTVQVPSVLSGFQPIGQCGAPQLIRQSR
jgi:SH3-like domain-containing protein